MKTDNFKGMYKKLINDTDLNNKYCVNDILAENVEIIFILESPHNEEVKCKYPLAGKSGVNMTKFFCKILGFDEPECKEKSILKCCDKIVPFGKLIKDAHSSKISDEKFTNGKLGDEEDFIIWSGIYEMKLQNEQKLQELG